MMWESLSPMIRQQVRMGYRCKRSLEATRLTQGLVKDAYRMENSARWRNRQELRNEVWRREAARREGILLSFRTCYAYERGDCGFGSRCRYLHAGEGARVKY